MANHPHQGRRTLLSSEEKIHAVMGEFKRGRLRSGSGKKVKTRAQAMAIAMREAGMPFKQR